LEMADQRYRRVADVVHAQLEKDVVALNVEKGTCFGMENVTAEVWNLLSRPASLDDICSQLLEIYDVDRDECRSDITELLDLMRREGLIEIAD